MELKLAKTKIDSKPTKITLEKLEEMCKDAVSKVFYFSLDNSHKDLLKVVSHFEKAGRSAHLNELKYGPDEKEYVYELHII